MFQTIIRPNSTWASPTGFINTCMVIVDYIGLVLQRQLSAGVSMLPLVVDLAVAELGC